MSSFGDYVDQAAAEVLSRNEILMATPGSSRISSFYPTPAESTNTIAQAVCNSGQLFVKANSKTFGGASDFQISTSNILDCPILSMRIDVPALATSDNLGSPENVFFGPFSQGWGFDAIESVEVSYANSNISNLRLDGIALKEWSLMQCETEPEKQQMLLNAGAYKVVNRVNVVSHYAAVPISFLNWRSAGGVKEGFPIDGRALNGPIQFQFRFRKLEEFMGPFYSFSAWSEGVSGSPTQPSVRISNPPPSGKIPTAFADLQMTFRTYQLMDGAFSVSKALMANPGMIYSIPSLWSNSYTYTVNMSGGKGSIQLNSAPAGMIQAILINVRPIGTFSRTVSSDSPPITDVRVDRLGYTSNPDQPGLGNVDGSRLATVPRYASAPLNYLRLQYSGQNIFLAQSAAELNTFYKQIYGNDLKMYVPCCNSARSVIATQGFETFDPQLGEDGTGSGTGVNYPDQCTVFLENQTYNIPLMHDGKRIFDERGFENLPHYSGSTLSLDFGIEDRPRGTFGCTRGDTGLQTEFVKASNDTIGNITVNRASSNSSGGFRHCPSDPNGGLNMTQRVYGDETDAVNTELYSGAVDWFKTFYNGQNGESQAIVTITYLVSALLQSTNGIVELQL